MNYKTNRIGIISIFTILGVVLLNNSMGISCCWRIEFIIEAFGGLALMLGGFMIGLWYSIDSLSSKQQARHGVEQ